MTQTTSYLKESFGHTTTSVNHTEVSTTSKPAKVINIETRLKVESVAPENYITLSELIANANKDQKKKDALERARARLAGSIKKSEGPTLRAKRLEMGWSQTKLAELLETSQSHVARIEKGDENLQLSTLRKLCKCFKIDMNSVEKLLSNQSKNPRK
ncbi:MAG: helix-turn-helix transcriptional regulator [Cobetia sp.]|jgi:ribosome-binding protein aMBF1 (putative translation factor)|uniref:helix-turn-helix domain-containing protein n=1 Tax=Cobetia sp. TaxID=1873876 RepID=UPI000C58E68B|nr:helix-turn-helix transcriptional regulator [Cobetia sp.]MBF09975.1 hypothetical protein [Cobetia sp.]|tara:strand:- start:579 stop:1049 length:471 start_codon:yes stop_codon:yes gene_type:complete